MSIAQLRKQFEDIPGAGSMTMRYEDGGAVQVYCIGGKEVRVGALAGAKEIRDALTEAIR